MEGYELETGTSDLMRMIITILFYHICVPCELLLLNINLSLLAVKVKREVCYAGQFPSDGKSEDKDYFCYCSYLLCVLFKKFNSSIEM